MDTYCGLVFYKALIIATESGYEHKAVDPFEAVNPFLPLRTLTADIKHVIIQLAEFEQGLRDSGSTKSGPQYILITWKVIFCEEAINIGVVARRSQKLSREKYRANSILLDIVM